MSIKCRECGYTRKSSDLKPVNGCPKCGLAYPRPNDFDVVSNQNINATSTISAKSDEIGAIAKNAGSKCDQPAGRAVPNVKKKKQKMDWIERDQLLNVVKTSTLGIWAVPKAIFIGTCALVAVSFRILLALTDPKVLVLTVKFLFQLFGIFISIAVLYAIWSAIWTPSPTPLQNYEMELARNRHSQLAVESAASSGRQANREKWERMPYAEKRELTDRMINKMAEKSGSPIKHSTDWYVREADKMVRSNPGLGPDEAAALLLTVEE